MIAIKHDRKVMSCKNGVALYLYISCFIIIKTQLDVNIKCNSWERFLGFKRVDRELNISRSDQKKPFTQMGNRIREVPRGGTLRIQAPGLS